MRAKNLVCFVLILLASGCERDSSQQPYREFRQVDILYRDFDDLAFAAYTEAALKKNHDQSISLTNTADIDLFMSALPKKCVQDSRLPRSKMDLHVLITLYGVDGRISTFSFSKFHYFSDASEIACELSPEDQAKLETSILKLAKRKGTAALN